MSKKDKEKKKKKADQDPEVAKPTDKKSDCVATPMAGFVERVYADGRTTIESTYWSLMARLVEYMGGNNVQSLHKKRRLMQDVERGKVREIPLDDLLHDETLVMVAAFQSDSNLQQAADYFTKKWHEKFPGRRAEVLASGKARFVDLPLLLPVGTPILVRDPTDSNRDLGAEVVRVGFEDWMGARLVFEVKFIEGLKGNAIYAQKRVKVRYFEEMLPFADLDVCPVDEMTRQRLTRRGETFLSLLLRDGAHYADYKGNIVLNYGWGERLVRADGRCMIDPAGFARFDETQYGAAQSQYSNRWWEMADSNEGSGSTRCTLTDDMLWMTSPTVAGYSLTAKRWGKFIIANVTEIGFRDDAINSLVLDERKKKLIIALVKHNDDKLRFRDVIEGKGGGTIFLLHGTPGTGKTLTAEAVAEALHQPLYSVSVGELGTDPESLENKLTTILELAAMWRAVLLLDEADIFLEKRGNDIARNAMVGVFLRLLEYHNGVLMLTTNRVKEFDAAFHSRISLAIKYPKMSRETREAVWLRLLDAAGFGHIDAAKLSHLEINGREVKNLIRIASISAKEEGVALTVQHLLDCHNLQREFLADAGADAKAPRTRKKAS